MNKSKIIYYLMLIVFVIFIIILNITFFVRNSNYYGKVNINKKYSEVIYLINDDTINSDNSIYFALNGKNQETFFTMNNIGNEKAVISSYEVNILDTNIDKNNIQIKTSMKANDIIPGGESILNKISIVCDDYLFKENDYVNFNIKYYFK